MKSDTLIFQKIAKFTQLRLRKAKIFPKFHFNDNIHPKNTKIANSISCSQWICPRDKQDYLEIKLFQRKRCTFFKIHNNPNSVLYHDLRFTICYVFEFCVFLSQILESDKSDLHFGETKI